MGRVSEGEREELAKPGARINVLKLVMKTVEALTGRGPVLQRLYVKNIESGS